MNISVIQLYTNIGDYMYVVITGATKGIGYEIAKIYADKKRDLILVARTTSILEEMTKEFTEKYEINVIFFSLDLSVEADVDKLLKNLDNYEIDTVINNAGFGLVEYFDKSSIEVEINILNLNVICFFRIFKYSYNRLTSVKNSYILNVGSIASFLPGPKSSVYFASKNFVKAITESVQYESIRQKNNVKISLLCPPPMETEFMKRANMHIKSKKMRAAKVAKVAISNLESGKKVIFPSIRSKMIYYSAKLDPNALTKRIMFRKIRKRNENT